MILNQLFENAQIISLKSSICSICSCNDTPLPFSVSLAVIHCTTFVARGIVSRTIVAEILFLLQLVLSELACCLRFLRRLVRLMGIRLPMRSVFVYLRTRERAVHIYWCSFLDTYYRTTSIKRRQPVTRCGGRTDGGDEDDWLVRSSLDGVRWPVADMDDDSDDDRQTRNPSGRL